MAVEDQRPFDDGLPTQEKIVTAAMRVYSQRGIVTTPLREIARAAGMSVGAVQHHFSTKRELTRAVNKRVLEIVAESIDPNREPVDGSTAGDDGLIQLMANDPTAMDYLRRVLVEEEPDSEVGRTIFDNLAKLSQAQGITFMAEGKLHDDVDFQWSFLNALILRLGAIILREHVERHQSGPFYGEEQLARWNASVRFLLGRGYTKTDRERTAATPGRRD